MEYNYNYLEDLLSHNEEESLKLEFKNSEALKDKKELAKDVSAMANSAGGVIIYGMNEKNHKADSLSTIDGDKYNKEWIENVLISNIHRPIEELKIHPIRIDENIAKSIYIVEIPESDDSPHMASNNRYYRRHNFQSIPMDEYEIRSLYFKTKTPNLRIESVANRHTVEIEEHKNGVYIFSKPIFQILNEGKGISFNHKILVEMDNLNHYNVTSIGGFASNVSISQSISGSGNQKFSIYNKTPIFPGELSSIDNFKFGYLKDEIVKEMKKDQKKIIVEILYDSGSDSMELSLNDFYRKTDYEKYL